MSETKTLDDEICDLLKTVADHFDKEDRVTRERQIRHWRRLCDHTEQRGGPQHL